MAQSMTCQRLKTWSLCCQACPVRSSSSELVMPIFQPWRSWTAMAVVCAIRGDSLARVTSCSSSSLKTRPREVAWMSRSWKRYPIKWSPTWSWLAKVLSLNLKTSELHWLGRWEDEEEIKINEKKKICFQKQEVYRFRIKQAIRGSNPLAIIRQSKIRLQT